MLVFATSDKGGTGRSVTSCNIAYRLYLAGKNVAYLDFDFGSPTSGALFEISSVERGVTDGTGLHTYLRGGRGGTVASRDVRTSTDRAALRKREPKSGKLVLFPGDAGGAEFLKAADAVAACAELLHTMEQEFQVTIVDLSAGRSFAVQMALEATAMPQLSTATARWLVFHRWTRQHILAANGLVHGEHGLLDMGAAAGHERDRLLESIRFVRTAVPAPSSQAGTERAAQAAWLLKQNAELKRLAATNNLGSISLLGETPMEPMLQWREQVILDADVTAKIANEATAAAFRELARRLTDDAVWERF
jgi:hypothetical protein